MKHAALWALSLGLMLFVASPSHAFSSLSIQTKNSGG